ncbi:hypothetical protein YC2023_050205 [Brassica napus]
MEDELIQIAQNIQQTNSDIRMERSIGGKYKKRELPRQPNKSTNQISFFCHVTNQLSQKTRDRGSIYSHDPSRQNWSYSLIHPIVSHKGEVDRHEKGFAGPERIQKLVKKYCQFVLFPIYTWQLDVQGSLAHDFLTCNREKRRPRRSLRNTRSGSLLETQPIWLQNSKEVTTMEYNEFYRITFKKYLNPLASPHFTTEARWKKTSVGIVRIMKKRLVEKASGMILRIYLSENREKLGKRHNGRTELEDRA